MPTLADVRACTASSLRQDIALPQDAGSTPSPDALVELARAWMGGLLPTLARQVSDWLMEHVKHGGSAADRGRYFSLLAALVPDLGEDGNPLVTHLDLAAGLDAAAYLLCVERHPRTGETARRLAGEYLQDLERRAYPGGEHLPMEIWRMRGKRLARVRRGFVRRGGGPDEDQMLELTFQDGAAVRIWAGYDGLMRFEDGPFEPLPDDDPSRLDVADADEAQLLADDAVWCVRDASAQPGVAGAIGRTLTDFRLRDRWDEGHMIMNLRFEAASVALAVIADLHLTIGWARDQPEPTPPQED